MNTSIRASDRAVLEISGENAAAFLHGLVTNDILALAPGDVRFAALLTPQGKILFDFLVFHSGDSGFFIDCPKALADEFEKRLNIYRLRAKVTVRQRGDALETILFPDAIDAPRLDAAALGKDPRATALGWRAIVAKGTIEAQEDETAYEARRIAACVPKGGVDFAYGDAFPHEANMDLLNGLNFGKGCYVGQEVVSRMKHRGLVRKRVARYQAQGDAPAPGAPIRAGEIEIGVTGSRAGREGLAMIRLDRLSDAFERGETPMAAGVALAFAPPETAEGNASGTPA